MFIISLLKFTLGLSASITVIDEYVPEERSGSVLVQDTYKYIYSIGGQRIQDKEIVSDVYRFEIFSLKWSKIVILSLYKPPGLIDHHAKIFKSEIFTLFTTNEVYILNLNTYSWSVKSLLSEKYKFIFCGNYLTSKYLAMFIGSLDSEFPTQYYM